MNEEDKNCGNCCFQRDNECLKNAPVPYVDGGVPYSLFPPVDSDMFCFEWECN